MLSGRSIVLFIGVLEIITFLSFLNYYDNSGIINNIDNVEITTLANNSNHEKMQLIEKPKMLFKEKSNLKKMRFKKKPNLEKTYFKKKTHFKKKSRFKKKHKHKKHKHKKYIMPDFEEISSLQKEPIPFNQKMECEGYHEKNGIPFRKLWNWPSVRVFIGIWSTEEKYEIRDLIRNLYLRQKINLIEDKVDFKFIIGKPEKEEYITKLSAENDTYGDLIVLDVKENMNSGKAYYYWKWVGKHLNSTEYDYVAKTDDDSFVHFQNLALNLRPLPRNNLYYGHVSYNKEKKVYYARGRLQTLSINYTQLFVSNPFNEIEWEGPEDIQLGIWMDKYTDSTMNRINEDCLMHNDPRIPIDRPIWRHWASPHSIVIHWLKNIHAWKSVYDLYFS